MLNLSTMATLGTEEMAVNYGEVGVWNDPCLFSWESNMFIVSSSCLLLAVVNWLSAWGMF